METAMFILIGVLVGAGIVALLSPKNGEKRGSDTVKEVAAPPLFDLPGRVKGLRSAMDAPTPPEGQGPSRGRGWAHHFDERGRLVGAESWEYPGIVQPTPTPTPQPPAPERSPDPPIAVAVKTRGGLTADEIRAAVRRELERSRGEKRKVKKVNETALTPPPSS